MGNTVLEEEVMYGIMYLSYDEKVKLLDMLKERFPYVLDRKKAHINAGKD